MHSSIKTILGIIALQIVFALIIAGAVYMGEKADAQCRPALQKPVNPWAPVRTCTR